MDLPKRVRSLFRVTAADIDEVRPAVWTALSADAYAESGEKYQAAILDQYKVYVEMADRVSARRGLANTFFLTLNTVVFTVMGASFKNGAPSAGLLFFPLLAMLVQCFAWFWLLRSYRQLNSAKYAVVGALEERLPASPYWRAEWEALGRGEDPARYWPLSHLEQWIPPVFAGIYVVTYVALLLG